MDQGQIGDFAQGDDLTIERTIAGVPVGASITDAWFMVKAKEADADAAALIGKHVTAAATADGQVLDGGSTAVDGTRAGAIVFAVTPSETAALAARRPHHYAIKAKLSTGELAQVESGEITALPGLIAATS